MYMSHVFEKSELENVEECKYNANKSKQKNTLFKFCRNVQQKRNTKTYVTENHIK